MVRPLFRHLFRYSLFLFFGLFSSIPCRSQTGKDGNRQVTAASTIINAYTSLSLDAYSGNTDITVANSSLNSGASFSGPLAPGDLIMIIQVQGASIHVPDDSTYGRILSYGNSGRYELCQVAAVPNATTVSLSCGLRYDYTAAGKTQVIRVPRFNRLTLSTGASITAPAWNGAIGGVVVIEADSELVINTGATIDMNGKGFRGGILSENLSALGVLNYRWPTGDYGAEKGESIAGYQTDYDSASGRYCKGAPANGGGGGSGHNCGGGGGANAGDTSLWTGSGLPDISVGTYASAWNLEFPGFAGSSSSGGGRGGYSFSSSNQDALTVGNYNTAWGGDYRRNNGGRGGRPLDYSSGRIFMGGGGGAGDQNDNRGGNGANGGGIVFITTKGNISGAGNIQSNGNNGFNSVASFNGNDAAGGGGAGGTVIISASGSVSGLSISANGGRGGNQNVGLFQNDAYGPGGGGGGGYIAVSNGTITRTASGGANGVTNSAGLLEFPPNGATKGADGLATEPFSTYRLSAVGDTVCAGDSTTLTVSVTGSLPNGTGLEWYTQPFDGVPVGSGSVITTPALFVNTTYYVGVCPGHYRIPVPVIVDAFSISISAPSSLPCAGSPGLFEGASVNTVGSITDWSWDFNDFSPNQSGQTVNHVFDSTGTYQVYLSATDIYGCQSVDAATVLISSPPVITATVSDSIGCAPFTVGFTGGTTGALAYTWSFGDSTSVNIASPVHTYTVAGVYTAVFTATTASCAAEESFDIIVLPVPDATITANPSSGCYPLAVTFAHQQYPGAIYSWNFGDGSTSVAAAPTHVFAAIGNYPVMLTVSLSGCAASDTFIITAGSPLSVSFTHDDGCFADPLNFVSSVVGAVASYYWDFGDGTSSTFNNLTHVYPQAGYFVATLTVTDANGCQASYSDTVVVQLPPSPGFTSTPASGCDTVTVFFTNTTTGAATYSWNFGDGTFSPDTSPTHTYTQPGFYNVSVATYSSLGCRAMFTRMPAVRVYATPVVDISSTDTLICEGDCISFSDNSSAVPSQWQWGFSGAVPAASNNSSSGQICYYAAGEYDVTLTVSNGTCTASETFPDYIHVTDCSIAPIASFICADSTFCVNGCTSFISLAQNATDWNWSFPGGSPATSTLPNPSGICYPAVGDYPVTLQVTNPAGSDVLSVTNLIHIASVPPIPSFVQSGDTLFAPQGYAGYQWYYNNTPIAGATAYRYLAMLSGNYSVAVTNVSGCRAISQQQHVSLVGLEEISAAFDLQVYPNPFMDELFFVYSGQRPVEFQVQLTDELGRLVFSEAVSFDSRSSEYRLETGNYGAGMYFLILTDGKGRSVRKLVRF